MKRRTCGTLRARRKTLRSRSAICRPIASRALSSGTTAAESAGFLSISSLARTVNVFNLHRPITSPRFLSNPRIWFSRSRFSSTSKARLLRRALMAWLSRSLTRTSLYHPHCMMRAMPAASLRSLLLICIFSTALAWRASMQITGSPSRLSPVHNQVAVGPVFNPTPGPVFNPTRTAFGALDLTNAAIASGSKSTTPSRTTDPMSFTTQIDTCFKPRNSRRLFDGIIACRGPQWHAKAGGQRATANQMTVAVRVVDAIDRAPILIAIRSRRITAKRSRIGPLPLFVGKVERSMRRIFQRVVAPRHAPRFDLPDFLPDCNHGVAETVDLRFRFRFCRLDHQCAGDRKAHGRRMEAIVDQAFCDVMDRDARGLLARPDVDDALMGDPIVFSFEQQPIMRLQPAGDVVRVQDGGLRCLGQAFSAHQQHVRPRDRQN